MKSKKNLRAQISSLAGHEPDLRIVEGFECDSLPPDLSLSVYIHHHLHIM